MYERKIYRALYEYIKYEHNSSISEYATDILSHGLTIRNVRCICTRKRQSNFYDAQLRFS